MGLKIFTVLALCLAMTAPALAEGVGAVTVDGKMIDVPVVERARLLLEREHAIAAREARSARAES